MGLFDFFNNIGNPKYIDVNNLCDKDKEALASRLRFKKVTIDNNGRQVYIVTEQCNIIHDLIYKSSLSLIDTKDCLVYLDNTPVLDRYGIMREGYYYPDNALISRYITKEDIEKDDRKIVKILDRYSIYNNYTSAKIRLRIMKEAENENKFTFTLTDKTRTEICLDTDNYFEVKRYSSMVSFYKAINKTGRPIYVMMYYGVAGGGTKDHMRPVKIEDGQVFLAEEKSLLDLKNNKVGDEAFKANVYSKMNNKLYTEGVESARNYMASNERYRDNDNIKERYSNGKVYTDLPNPLCREYLIASRPFDLKDIKLFRRNLYRDAYISIMKQLVPNYDESYECTYTLTHKLINDKEDTVGYKIKRHNVLSGRTDICDISLEETFNLVNNNKATNATIVLSENKRPYIRCDKELEKVHIII